MYVLELVAVLCLLSISGMLSKPTSLVSCKCIFCHSQSLALLSWPFECISCAIVLLYLALLSSSSVLRSCVADIALSSCLHVCLQVFYSTLACSLVFLSCLALLSCSLILFSSILLLLALLSCSLDFYQSLSFLSCTFALHLALHLVLHLVLHLYISLLSCSNISWLLSCSALLSLTCLLFCCLVPLSCTPVVFAHLSCTLSCTLLFVRSVTKSSNVIRY